MAITVTQINAALQAIDQLERTLATTSALLGKAQQLANAGWVFDVGVSSPILITITPTQQQAMVAQYDALKSQLVTTFGQLP